MEPTGESIEPSEDQEPQRSLWLLRNIRLLVLLAGFALVLALALGKWTREGRASRGTIVADCPAVEAVAATLRPDELVALRAQLLAVMPAGARPYTTGVVTPARVAAWGRPESIRGTRERGGYWPGGYAIQRRSRDGDFLVAYALRFGASDEADRYLQELLGPACEGGGTKPSSKPPDARRTVILPYPHYVTYMVELVRGAFFYRIVDDRFKRPWRFPSAPEQQAGFARLDELACRLPVAGCTPADG